MYLFNFSKKHFYFDKSINMLIGLRYNDFGGFKDLQYFLRAQ